MNDPQARPTREAEHRCKSCRGMFATAFLSPGDNPEYCSGCNYASIPERDELRAELAAARAEVAALKADLDEQDRSHLAAYREWYRDLVAAREENERLKAVLKDAGRSKRACVGTGPDEDAYELCWCQCISDRCVDEPQCRAAAATLAAGAGE